MASLIAWAIILFFAGQPNPPVDRMWSTFIIPPKHIGTPPAPSIIRLFATRTLATQSPVSRINATENKNKKKLITDNPKLKTLYYLCTDNRFKLRALKELSVLSLVTRQGFFLI